MGVIVVRALLWIQQPHAKFARPVSMNPPVPLHGLRLRLVRSTKSPAVKNTRKPLSILLSLSLSVSLSFTYMDYIYMYIGVLLHISIYTYMHKGILRTPDLQTFTSSVLSFQAPR